MQPLKLAAVPENPSVANLKWTVPKMVVYGYGTGFTDSCSPWPPAPLKGSQLAWPEQGSTFARRATPCSALAFWSGAMGLRKMTSPL
jgi:hypothetical protein